MAFRTKTAKAINEKRHHFLSLCHGYVKQSTIQSITHTKRTFPDFPLLRIFIWYEKIERNTTCKCAKCLFVKQT